MFGEWVAAGCIVGFKAFFALAVFLLCCAFLLGLLGTIAGIINGVIGDDDDGEEDGE